ncbi:response regulator transcription factor [Paenibacillus herberti]|uniref:DNA-binding response regulator n=1 Tax=Paenibacillus herberti TaxID=1619309 RepID=A0A229NTU6_9BACL|nr:response regulator [Paenibacillus herberti]OXM13327.1 DNA-binding response regulator [Paenibacillus herberti]
MAIKVLVVDDDKLVRRGLISFLPWQAFNMEVVGEASNGEKALEFLECNPVDLLLTDLSMPVMSGIELLRNARKRYPHLHMAVLTLHQDFEYIQEALRLGAIDYIAKVQMEEEQYEEILGRIAARIKEDRNQRSVSLNPDQIIAENKQGYVLLSMAHETELNWPQEVNLPQALMMEAERNSWVWFVKEEQQEQVVEVLMAKAQTEPESVLLVLTDIAGCGWKDLQRWLREYREQVLFYDYHPDHNIRTVSILDEPNIPAGTNELELEKVKVDRLFSRWFQNDRVFDGLIQEMKSLRLPEKKLVGFLYSLVIEWNRLFAGTQFTKIQMIPSLHSWYQVELWIRKIRKSIHGSVGPSSHSQEILDCITKAVSMIQEELSTQLTAAELAQRLNLSRGYFSQCFKDIIGKTFNEYSRFIRIEKAREYLLNTNHTIVWIAEQTGYADEKYFSRIFRESTGTLPSEYRQTHRLN